MAILSRLAPGITTPPLIPFGAVARRLTQLRKIAPTALTLEGRKLAVAKSVSRFSQNNSEQMIARVDALCGVRNLKLI